MGDGFQAAYCWHDEMARRVGNLLPARMLVITKMFAIAVGNELPTLRMKAA